MPTPLFVRPSDIVWKPQPALPPGARFAVLVGDMSREGPLTFRVEAPAGHRVMPHSHPEDRVYTVLTGEFRFGFADALDLSRQDVFAPGSVLVVPARQPHFQIAGPEGYAIQINSTGPTSTDYVQPADDPRRPPAHA